MITHLRFENARPSKIPSGKLKNDKNKNIYVKYNYKHLSYFLMKIINNYLMLGPDQCHDLCMNLSVVATAPQALMGNIKL